MIIVIEVR